MRIPSCCCGEKPGTDTCTACENNHYCFPVVEIAGLSGDCCSIYNGSYQTGHWGKSSYHWPCGGYADGPDVVLPCSAMYPWAVGFLLMCYVTDTNSDGIADTVHFYIMDSGEGRARIGGSKSFTGNCRDLDVTLTAADLTVWGVGCTKTGATVRIYVP